MKMALTRLSISDRCKVMEGRLGLKDAFACQEIPDRAEKATGGEALLLSCDKGHQCIPACFVQCGLWVLSALSMIRISITLKLFVF